MTDSNRERRRAPRIAANFPIRLDGQHQGQLRDLSELGLCCTYPAPIEEMTQVRFGLEIPGEDKVHEVQGAVVRCDPVMGRPETHEIAVYFTESNADARDAVRRWIRNNLDQSEQSGSSASPN